jgi:hypothetical protein
MPKKAKYCMPKTLLPRVAVLEDQSVFFQADLKQIKDDIREIKNKLDEVYLKKAEFVETKTEGDLIHENHEKRISSLEQWKAWVLGAVGLAAFTLGIAATLLANHLGAH